MKMRREAVQNAASLRPEGYVDEVLAACRDVGDGWLEIEESDYLRLKHKYDPQTTAGPGTELKLLLAGFPFYIKTSPGCACNKRAKYMDKMGAEWCSNNMGQIVSWLKEEHARQKLKVPFSSLVAHRLVKLAIQRAIVK